MKNGTIATIIRNKIKFLEWARLSPRYMSDLGFTGNEKNIPVYISPDVNSLHIVWIHDNEVSHEIADFPEDGEYESVGDWLSLEIFDDAWGTFDYDDNDDDIFDGLQPEDVRFVDFH